MTPFSHFLARIFLWLGILLPVFTLGFELSTHACAGSFFDPLPTRWHVLAILPVPVACFLTWRLWKKPSVRLIHWTGFINRAAWPAMLLYGIAFAPLSLVACSMLPFAIAMLGGEFILSLMIFATLGPLAGLIGLSIATGSLRRLRALLPSPAAQRGSRLCRYGWLTGLAVLLLAEGPAVWTQFWMARAAREEGASQAQALQMLRHTGNTDLLLQTCYEGRERNTFGPTAALLTEIPGLSQFFSLSIASSTPARQIYYKVTGIPFNAVPPPRQSAFTVRNLGEVDRSTALEGFVWDGDRGGDTVGARLRGLSLATSNMEWHLDSPSALAHGEWTLEFSNRHGNPQEARCQILLPPGGCVSRVNLWINGKPEEAAFGAKAQVKAAYRQVVRVERRDPVMVTMSGPDRIMTQCFPVPPGGTMKIRLGITAPCDESTAGKLAPPLFIERNFSVPATLQHHITTRSDAGSPTTREVSDAELASLRFQPASGPATSVWAEDPFAQTEPKFLVRTQEAVRQQQAQRVIAVVDGSLRLRPHATAIREALQAIPAHIKLTTLLTTDLDPLIVERNALEHEITKGAFAGGRNSAPALKRALELAQEGNDPAATTTTILWLQGPQPWTFEMGESASQPENRDSENTPTEPPPTIDRSRLTRLLKSLPKPPVIHAVSLSQGPNRLLEKLYQTTELRSGSRWDGTPAGLKALVGSIVGEGEHWQHRFARQEAAPTDGSPKVWDQLVRHHVYEEVLNAFKGTDVIPAQLAQKAALYQLVTPYSGAVVLETQQQYNAAGLSAVDPNSSPKIPSMVPEPSRMLLLLLASAAMILRRRRL